MGAMTLCQSCQRKGGFFGPKVSKCPGCDQDLCDSCLHSSCWTIMTGTDHMTDYDECKVCSGECIFKEYLKNLPRLGPEGGVQLSNEDKVIVGIYDSNGSKGFAISMAYMHIDGGHWSRMDHMAPEAKRMYERIKADLDRQGIHHTEVFENII